ncbi:MAG: DNA-binding protein [Proteobacteria bacterium]|nr:DNA-binding protein [Pseudomonadota bacterium]
MHRRLTVYSIAVLFALSLAAVPTQSIAMPKSAVTADAKTATGTVIETMNAAGYTYMLVAAGKTQNWVAIPETTVKAGSQVSYYEGMTMPAFTSKTLGKTFENIIFSTGLKQNADTAAPSPTAKAPVQDDSFSAALQLEQKNTAAIPPMAQSTGGSAVAIAPLQEISVPKAQGENAYTVGEIFTKSKELNGKKVRLRGKVVKFSPNIMGKNWVHLQDGTGDPLHNSHDLVLTTETILAVDSIVTMEGLLAADKDFGAGYKYTAIVEQASIIK